jgi:hypothetical protein
LQIAEKEAERKEQVERALTFISQQLEQLDILELIQGDADLDNYESLFNRAMDVRSASMIYLAVHIHHDATPLGSIGVQS